MCYRRLPASSPPTSRAASLVAWLAPAGVQPLPRRPHGPRTAQRVHWRRVHVGASRYARMERSSILFFALALSLREQFLKHGGFPGLRFQEPSDLPQALLRHRGQYEPSVFLAPSGRSSFFQSKLLAQFGRNHHLAFGADYRAVACHDSSYHKVRQSDIVLLAKTLASG